MNGGTGYSGLEVKRERKPDAFSPTETIADHLPALLLIYNPVTNRLEYANRMVDVFADERLAGGSGQGEEPESIFHPADLEAFHTLVSLSGISDGRSNHCIARLADARGNYRSYSVEVHLLNKNDNQEAPLIRVMANDITGDLKDKEEFETTRELLDETEELLQFGSWAWEISTNIVSWTPGLYSLLGYDPKEVEGRIGLGFYLSHVLDEYSQTFQDILESAMKEKSDFSYEYVIRTKSGALKTISTRGKLVKDTGGDVLKMLCINRDITALRTFEKEQERNMRELNRSNRDLEEFAYIASHDLQEPLRKISMFTERLKAKYDNALDSEGTLFVERILASAANMRILIDDLLNFSRANRRTHTFDVVDFNLVFEDVISELELNIEETRAVIRFTGTLPTIQAVTSEMKQLFANILSNAIKFRKQDVPPEIEVRSGKVSRTEKQTLGLPATTAFHRIEVHDNGIGFENEYSERIFQIFQRLNGKAEYPGSGIGLAICKKIVEKHNGLIFAKSAPDSGATFTVILPEKQF